MSRRLHFAYDERLCNCGDSFCHEDYEWVTRVACKRGEDAPGRFTTKDITKVTCETCAKSEPCRRALANKIQQTRDEAAVTLREQRDRYRAALERIHRGDAVPHKIAAEALFDPK